MASLTERMTEAPAPAPEGLQLFSKISTAAAELNASRERILAVVRDQVRVPLEEIIRCAEDIAHPGASGPSADSVERIRDAAHHLLLILDTTAATPSALAGSTAKLSLTRKAENAAATATKGSLLIVDDNELGTEILSQLLIAQGYSVQTSSSGETALVALHKGGIDVVLLDFNLPGMNGIEVLCRMKADELLRDIPVVMLSGEEQSERVIAAIERGAEDFLPKPFNNVLLRARIDSSLEKKRFRDHDRAMMQDLQLEQAKAEALLLNVLPKPVADRLKQGHNSIVDAFPAVTVLFADLVEFTSESARSSPAEIVRWLNMIFSEFDRLAELYGLEKIKTIGDAYMVAGGLNDDPERNYSASIAGMAIDMRMLLAGDFMVSGRRLQIRMGIGTGPVVAGVVGKKKFIYDLWGDTVNIASRITAEGGPGNIQVDATTYRRLRDLFEFDPPQTVYLKGKGDTPIYRLLGRKDVPETISAAA